MGAESRLHLSLSQHRALRSRRRVRGEGSFLFLFADPGGIGSAFHRAEDGEKK